MLTIDSLSARVRRLNELCIGLAKETIKPNAVDGDILHFVERNDYTQALHDAVEGLERARVALVTALYRIEDEDATARRK